MATTAKAAIAADEQQTPAAFGTVFTEKMAVCHYAQGVWSIPEIGPTREFSLHPAAHVFHYGSSCFEGLKAYRWKDGSVRVFRLDRHVERMRRSAGILCLPDPGEQRLTAMVRDAVAACRDEVPASPGSLYIRPTMIGTSPDVGAAGSPASDVCLFVLLSPVGDYFSGGERPLKILIEDEHMRSTPEFGSVKTGANYVSSLRYAVAAKRDFGADQVLFCPGGDVQETGASNFLLLNDHEIVTKPLNDSFLHGVTRDSILSLARQLNYTVTERNFTVPELLAWCTDGEAALTGTAAVMTAVGTFVYRGKEHLAAGGRIGPNTRRLREALTAIQTGTAADTQGWLAEV